MNIPSLFNSFGLSLTVQLVVYLIASLLTLICVLYFVYACSNMNKVAQSDSHQHQFNNKFNLRSRNFLFTAQFLHVLSASLLITYLCNSSEEYIFLIATITTIYILTILFDKRPRITPSSILLRFNWFVCYLLIEICLILFDYLLIQRRIYFEDYCYHFSTILTFIATILTYFSIHEKVQLQHYEPTLEFTSSLWSYLSISFLNPLIHLGQSKDVLDNEDVPTFCDGDTCEYIYKQVFSYELNQLSSSTLTSAPNNNNTTTDNTNTMLTSNSNENSSSDSFLDTENNTQINYSKYNKDEDDDLNKYINNDNLLNTFNHPQSPSLMMRIIHLIKYDFCRQAAFQFVSSTIGFLPPLALQRILVYISSLSAADHLSTASASSTYSSLVNTTTNSSSSNSSMAYSSIYNYNISTFSPVISNYSDTISNYSYTSSNFSGTNSSTSGNITRFLSLSYTSYDSNNRNSSGSSSGSIDNTHLHAHISSSSSTHVINIMTSFSVHAAIVMLFLGPMIQCICYAQNYLRSRRLACKLRSALTSILYQKSMSIDLSALLDGPGTLNNLISVDVKEIMELFAYFHFIWSTVLEVSICLYLLYILLGISAFGGIFIMCLSFPLGAIGSKYLDISQKQMLKIKDSRMSVMTEILSGIRIIKWYVWEDNFRDKVTAIREQELSSLRSYMVYDALLRAQWGLLPILVGLVTFLVHTQVLGKTLLASEGFTALLLFSLLRRPMTILPDMISMFIRARISYLRILKFLSTPSVVGLKDIDSQSDTIYERQLNMDKMTVSDDNAPSDIIITSKNMYEYKLDRNNDTIRNPLYMTSTNKTTVADVSSSTLQGQQESSTTTTATTTTTTTTTTALIFNHVTLAWNNPVSIDHMDTDTWAASTTTTHTTIANTGSNTSNTMSKKNSMMISPSKKFNEFSKNISMTNLSVFTRFPTTDMTENLSSNHKNASVKVKRRSKSSHESTDNAPNPTSYIQSFLGLLSNFTYQSPSVYTTITTTHNRKRGKYESITTMMNTSEDETADDIPVVVVHEETKSYLSSSSPHHTHSLTTRTRTHSTHNYTQNDDNEQEREDDNDVDDMRSIRSARTQYSHRLYTYEDEIKEHMCDALNDTTTIITTGGKKSRTKKRVNSSVMKQQLKSKVVESGEGYKSHNDQVDVVDAINEDQDLLVTYNIDNFDKNHTGNTIILKDLSFSIPKGALTAVVGSTGSGKSSLLAGILGENIKIQGHITMLTSQSLSISTQSAWIQNGSLRQNILFGLPYEPIRYNQVIYACALIRDLQDLPHGDRTDIGEKGVNLSGGQQQRVSLARAAYAYSDIILLDDPLSAVDGFLKHRTRILVTHQVSLVLPSADYILCLDGLGGLAAQGPPDQFHTQLVQYVDSLQHKLSQDHHDVNMMTDSKYTLNQHYNLTLHTEKNDNQTHVHVHIGEELKGDDSTEDMMKYKQKIRKLLGFFDILLHLNLHQHVKKPLTQSREENEHNVDIQTNTISNDNLEISISKVTAATSATTTSTTTNSDDSTIDIHNPLMTNNSNNNNSNYKKEDENEVVLLVEKETKASGGVGWNVYWFYLKSCGGYLPPIILIGANISITLAWFLYNYTLGEWMAALELHMSHSTVYMRLIYYILAVSICLSCIIFLHLYKAFCALYASRTIHHTLLTYILETTLYWHDTQPSGRKMNRFSQDISTIDSTIINNLQDFFDCLLSTIQVLFVISILLPWMIPFLFPIILYNLWVSSRYLKVTRELKRLESINKSPIFALFSETLTGLSVIRAFRHETRFMKLCFQYIDMANRCHFYMWTTNRWLNFRTQFMGAIVTGSVAWAVVSQASTIGSTIGGLVLIYAMNFTDSITYLTRFHGDCQMNLNSVERVMEYCAIEREKYNDGNTDNHTQSTITSHMNPISAILNPIHSKLKSQSSTIHNKTYTQISHDKDIIDDDKSDVQSVKSTKSHLSTLYKKRQQKEVYAPILTSDEDDVDEYDKDDGDINVENRKYMNSYKQNDKTSNIEDNQSDDIEMTSTVIPTTKNNEYMSAEHNKEKWPQTGSIEFVEIEMKYRITDPPVLKLVSFYIPTGYKVGVCGRSGAGKSSLISALFRTVEPCHGDILISNQSIMNMPLKQLRKHIAIVPQEPVLFRRSIKSNLDPFNEFSDKDIWDALEKVHMADYVAHMAGGTGQKNGPMDEILVSERGTNFSVGQRQLLCMARALLRKSKILILDEATASVDAETDALIQETVRKELHHITVLSIAHRLHTIAYYDKVLVMDKGKVVEYDTPLNLLINTNSVFYDMCVRSGDLHKILNMAKQS